MQAQVHRLWNSHRAGVVFFYILSFGISACIATLWHGSHPASIYALTNFMGPLTEHLVHHLGYVTCTASLQSASNPICFHVHRMPLRPFLLAALVRIFGDHYLAVDLAKIALVLVPVAASFSLVCKRLTGIAARSLRWQVPLFLLCSLMLPTLMVDVIHLQVEEAYSFCLLSYATAMLLFGMHPSQQRPRTAFAFALAVLGLYLTKSSMILACIFFVLTYCLLVTRKQLRWIVVLVAICGPLGWGAYSVHATGRFTLGTSLDGINLHKGNNARFLDRYPPADCGSLDRYDPQLSKGMHFATEWQLNDFHTHASLLYIKAHPVSDLRADGRKLDVFFFTLRKIGSQQYTGRMGRVTEAGMLLFRLLLWSACALAILALWKEPGEQRKAAIIFAGVVICVATPYVIGFAFTRHASVLILPSALYLVHRRLGGTIRPSLLPSDCIE